ncbi:transposase [Ancylomarina sp. YFZ004]
MCCFFLKKLVDTNAINIQSLETYYGIKAQLFRRQYKESLSCFRQWRKKSHAQEHLVYPKNIGPHLALDETALSNGELYTLLTNKDSRGKKACIVGIFKGTQAKQIISLIRDNIPEELRSIVKGFTFDMAGSMNFIVRKCFLKAEATTDRLHIQQLANDAVQELRIKYRWEIINSENADYKKGKAKGKIYKL